MGSTLSAWKFIQSPFEDPHNLYRDLSPEHKAILQRCFEGLDPRFLLDAHIHVAGIGTDGSGCYANHRYFDFLRHAIYRLKYMFICKASGVKHDDFHLDRHYIDRLVTLLREVRPENSHLAHAQCVLLALDQIYDHSGLPQPDLTAMYVPNEYVHKLVLAHPGEFLMACSVHPYRPDALQELEKWPLRGVRVVKWLPNIQLIDLEDEKCVVFYHKLRQLNMILLCHLGWEMSLDSPQRRQDVGSPLKLRTPLNLGVTVIAAHAATAGFSRDTDHQGWVC
eukprot:TRINITY_DN4922_c0_g1_i1.p1 TRINITY_DN4922_c0_g1~~TRINITY_DN4922_c0_g1_i1.p1  ORF type:complete len:279 (+),score=8.52 TRINITY_DN4922_c0_g1_i1:310-1146(+)